MRIFLILFIFAPVLRGNPLAGAWETFSNRDHADGWSLYSYGDGIVAPPLWAGPEIDENPYAYSYFFEGDGVWFFADDFTARGAFTGNYAAEKISGVDVSVSVDPAEIDFIDLVVYADGPLGPDYYYSLVYFPEDLGELPDWYDLSFSFGESWFSLEDGDYTAFEPDEEFLGSVEKIGVRIFPVAVVGEGSFVGVDDFILVPTVEGPSLATSLSGGDFVLDFTLNPGVSGTIEKLAPDFEWEAVSGQTGLTGTRTYTTPLGSGTGLFRVAAEEKLTEVGGP